MTEPQDFFDPKELPPSTDVKKGIEQRKEEDTSPVSEKLQRTRGAVEGALDPVLGRKEQKLKELAAKREAKELSPYDFDLNFIFRLNESGLPLTRKDMLHETGNQALVLTREDFEILGCLDFIHASGERMLIEPESLDPNDVFVLYPHEVGDEEA